MQVLAVITALWVIVATSATAQDVGATMGGDWGTGSIWTTGTVPDGTTNVFIGSSYPGGAAATVSVALSGNQAANNVSLGYGPGTSGTLDLGSSALTVNGSLVLGSSSGGNGTGTIIAGAGGFFSAPSVFIDGGSSLTFGANDSTGVLQLANNSIATTAATGNVSGTVNVAGGSTFNLGANLNVIGEVGVRDAGSTLDMGGHAIAADSIRVGWLGGSAVTVRNQGTITANSLLLASGQTYTMLTGDRVKSVEVAGGATLTTAATENISRSMGVSDGSTLALGADLSLSGFVVRGAGTTLNMAGHALIDTGELSLGYYGDSAITVQNQGTITAGHLLLGNGQVYTLLASDRVTGLTVAYGATLTTTATGNISNSVELVGASTLNLGADLILREYLRASEAATLDMGGHSISVQQMLLGEDGLAVTVLNQGTITTNGLRLGHGQTYNLLATDRVDRLSVKTGAVASTAATGNIFLGVEVSGGSTLTLGADLRLQGNLRPDPNPSGNLDIWDPGSTLDMGGHAISARSITLNYYGTQMLSGPAVTVLNQGTIRTNSLSLGHWQTYNLLPGDRVYSLIVDSSASATTTTQGNVFGSVNVSRGGQLYLNADLNLSGDLVIQDLGSWLDARGHAITANTISLGWSGNTGVVFQGQGAITASGLYVGHWTTYRFRAGDSVGNLFLDSGAQAVTPTGAPMLFNAVSVDHNSGLLLHGGDTITGSIALTGNCYAMVEQVNGAGLTFDGSALAIEDSSFLRLVFREVGWTFRWLDAVGGGDWISQMTSLISGGRVVIDLPPDMAYQVVDRGGYTYVETLSVPEPSASAMALAGLACGGYSLWRRRKRALTPPGQCDSRAPSPH